MSASPLTTVSLTSTAVVNNQSKPGDLGDVSVRAPLVFASRHLLQPNGSILGTEVAAAVLPLFPSVWSAVPQTMSTPALYNGAATAAPQRPMTHGEIAQFMVDLGQRLQTQLGIGRGHRVGLVLPNGPELALAILTLSNWTTVVPLNAFGAQQELEADLNNASCDVVIGMHELTGSPISQLALKLQIPFVGLQPTLHVAGLFQLHFPTDAAVKDSLVIPRKWKHVYATPQQYIQQCPHRFEPNSHEDEILVLFTSGTTGSKKLVPHCLAEVLIATACIAVSWKLTPTDINCNLMPLFHVGGIIRQVYSVILSGGAVICCPSFDPNLFWQLLLQTHISSTSSSFTWYYAAPTMHQLILQTGRAEGYIPDQRKSADSGSPDPTQQHRLRMIANAAGGLLPSLARELRQAFGGAHVLPSYGMTECMPMTSPPATYQLEKPGTSGVAVGPEIQILNLETLQPHPFGKEGAICVRGQPCFRGYGVIAAHKAAAQTAAPNAATFLPHGWFNTGDLGYMDSDGYLYITGRAKEVINRGGELISPLEVEEAVIQHPLVRAAVAFSTQHAVLQEVVGILVVPVKNAPRIDLPTLHEYLGEGRLAAPKWPQCLVYMEDQLPKSHTNKVLRVKLGQRLGLPELNDSMYFIERTFSATCPKQGTPVSVAIPCQRVQVNPDVIEARLRQELAIPPPLATASEDQPPQQELWVRPHPSKLGHLVVYVHQVSRIQVVQKAQQVLDAYAVPSHVCDLPAPLYKSELPPPQPFDAIASIVQEARSFGQGPTDPLVSNLQEVFQNLLDLDCLPAPETNFFNLGGSSMLASQLASKIRKIHNVPFGGAEVFHHPTVLSISNLIRERRGEDMGDNGSNGKLDKASLAASSLFSKNLDLGNVRFDPTRMDNYSDCGASLLQLAPLLIIYPMWQLSRFFLFFRVLLAVLHKVPGGHNLLAFVFTLVVFHFCWVLFTPLVFVVLKWTIVGRYREGRYPIWGDTYMRWWLVDVMRKLIGRGFWGSHETLLNFYYRMLGAEIGNGARISLEAEIAEYDLVRIGENASIEYATVRGFAVDNGCMLLAPVAVGHHASVGARSVVAPYTAIPDHAHLGAVTSSYEVNNLSASPGADIKHLRYNRYALPEPNLIWKAFAAGPIIFFCDTLSHMPALLVLYWMVKMPWHKNEPFETMSDLMEWLCDPRRIPFYIGIRVARAIGAPIVYMFAAVLMKWIFIGKFQPGPRDTTSEWQLTRHYLVATLFSRENMQDFTELIGRHYELVSVLYRALGAKVGKRVFWPGHQPIFSGEFDLLEIGDDVVFGSRATIFCTTADSCERVIFCAGSNVSDNTVVLPGSIIGKNAVLGSNSVCPAGRYLPESSVWFGARGGEPVMLERGSEEAVDEPILSSDVSPEKLQMLGDDSTLRPFGRAFYLGQAPYFVLPLPFMIAFTFVVKVIIAMIHTLPIVAALHFAAGFIYGFPYYDGEFDYYETSMKEVYATMSLVTIVTHFFRVSLWLAIEIGAKWLLLGRRREGRYNWDQSSYGQRWELYQLICRVRSVGRMNFLDLITGTPYMATFFRMLGGRIGHDCCLYPAGGDPYMPEPDLVEMGNHCVIDCASVVCHLNTRGNFELTRIRLENNVTLRTRSRIQQGVHMETNSMILEKSLVMTGEVIEAESVWMGAPASRLLSYDTSSLGSRPSMQLDNSNNRSILEQNSYGGAEYRQLGAGGNAIV